MFLLTAPQNKQSIALRLLLLTGSNFSDFAILFTFRVLNFSDFGFQPQNTLTANSLVDHLVEPSNIACIPAFFQPLKMIEKAAAD